MLREEESIGVISIRRTMAGPFSEKQIKLLQTFADQAVIAIENTRLFQELQTRTQELAQSVEQLKALAEVGEAVNSTLDLQKVLETIVARAVQLSGTSGGAVYEFDDASSELRLRATHGLEPELVDVLLAFPYLLLALIIVAVLGPSLTNSVIAIGIIYTPQYARLMRGQVLSVQAADFVVAARAIGAGRLRVMLRHVLPNSFTPVLVLATLQSGAVVVETAGLSFLGLGAQPPSPDWGALLAEGHGYFLTAWWIATFPGMAIFLVVVGFNLLGDALRDQYDPRLRAR
jgi:GAF domain-containing protein